MLDTGFNRFSEYLWQRLAIGLTLTLLGLLAAKFGIYYFFQQETGALFLDLASTGAVLAVVSVWVYGFLRPLKKSVTTLENILAVEAPVQDKSPGQDLELGYLAFLADRVSTAIDASRLDKIKLTARLAEATQYLDRIPLGIVIEKEDRIESCNQCFANMAGYEPDELQGKPLGQLLVPASPLGSVGTGTTVACKVPGANPRPLRLLRRDREPSLVIQYSAQTTLGHGDVQALIRAYIDLDQVEEWQRSTTSAQGKPKEVDSSSTSETSRWFQPTSNLPSLAREVRPDQKDLPAMFQPTAKIDQAPNSTSVAPSATARENLLPFDLNSAMAGVARLLAGRVGKKGIELVLDIDCDTRNYLVGDSQGLTQAINILAGNVLDLAAIQELVLSVRQRARDDSSIELLFSIAGRGVRQESSSAGTSQETSPIPESSQARPSTETNLKLAIGRRLVQLLGGNLWAEGSPGPGWSFHFTARFQLGAPDAGKHPPYKERLKTYAGRRVMVIDDNASNRHILGALLTKLGFMPDLFDSGRAAFNAVVAKPGEDYLFCCIDWLMPGQDGMEAADLLRSHWRYRCPPLVLLTPSGQGPDLQRVKRTFTTCLSKPLTLDQTFHAVTSVLRVSDGPAKVQKPKIAQPLLSRLKGKRLLLVEQNRLYREVITNALQEANARVRYADHGLEALQAVSEETPDCILMDCHTPIMDGFEASARLRAFGYDRIPIIALTVNDPARERQRCVDAGMNDVISKPFDLAVLLAKIIRWTTVPGPGIPQPAASAAKLPLTTPAAPESTLPPLPPGLDIENGLRRLHGNRSLFLKALRIFRDSRGQQFQQELRGSIAVQDWTAAERLAGSLKGTAASIGANDVALAAARLETAIQAGCYGEVQVLLADLTEKLQIIVEGLARIG